MQNGKKLAAVLVLFSSALAAQTIAPPTIESPTPVLVAQTAAPPPAAPPPAAPPPAPPPPPPSPWSADLSIGYVKSSGNAQSSTLNFKGDVDYKSDPWEDTLSANAYKANSNGTNTDEKYAIGDKLLYNLDPNEYLFGQLNADDDRYGAVAQRYSGAAGYGRHFIKTATQTLDIDLGLGADHTRQQEANHYQTNLIGTFDGAYVWKISANSQFKQTLRTAFAGNNTFINPVTELKLNIVKNFFATLGYELRYNSTTIAPSADNPTGIGTYHTDQITTINIGYTFGKPITPVT